MEAIVAQRSLNGALFANFRASMSRTPCNQEIIQDYCVTKILLGLDLVHHFAYVRDDFYLLTMRQI